MAAGGVAQLGGGSGVPAGRADRARAIVTSSPRAIVAAAEAGRKVSVAGSGHSFTEAAMTDGTMIDIGALDGVIDVDPCTGPGQGRGRDHPRRLNRELDRLGLAMENLGDIDRQTVAGAISTGTHGTGARLGNLSTQVVGVELVTADGEVARAR